MEESKPGNGESSVECPSLSRLGFANERVKEGVRHLSRTLLILVDALVVAAQDAQHDVG